jgi:non-specific serine/threonine protein kinase
LNALARLAALLGRPRRAVRLAGAAEGLYRAIGPSLAVRDDSRRVVSTTLLSSNPEVNRVAQRLGLEQREAAWQEGAELTSEQAIAEALGLEAELPTGDGSPVSVGVKLTRRERDAVALLARGYSNRQIATELVITEGSAHMLVVRLLNKLGLHSRAQVAAWAVEHPL